MRIPTIIAAGIMLAGTAQAQTCDPNYEILSADGAGRAAAIYALAEKYCKPLGYGTDSIAFANLMTRFGVMPADIARGGRYWDDVEFEALNYGDDAHRDPVKFCEKQQAALSCHGFLTQK